MKKSYNHPSYPTTNKVIISKGVLKSMFSIRADKHSYNGTKISFQLQISVFTKIFHFSFWDTHLGRRAFLLLLYLSFPSLYSLLVLYTDTFLLSSSPLELLCKLCKVNEWSISISVPYLTMLVNKLSGRNWCLAYPVVERKKYPSANESSL